MKSGANFFADILGALAERAALYVMSTRQHFGARRNKLKLLFIALCAACTLAVGQGSGSSPNPTPQVQTQTAGAYAWSIDSVISKIAQKVTSKLTELENNSKLQGWGKLITAFFLIAMLVWTSLKTMASGKGIGELVGEWVPIFISFGIVTMFLERSAANLIVSTMDGIGAAIGGANMSTLDAAIRTGAEPIFKAIAAVVNQPRATSGTNVIGDGGIMGFVGTMAASAASWVMGAIAKVLTAFLLVLAGAIMVGHIIMGFISIRLVLALAPVMVPFLMFKPMSWLFDGWLKFLLGACMLKIVVAFLLNVVAGLLSGMSEFALELYNESWKVSAAETLHVDILMLGMTLVFAALATLLLMQAPGLATGLLSGSAGGVGFSGLKGVTQGVGSRVSSGTASGVGAGAGSSVAQGARNGMSWMQGRADAKAGRAPSNSYRDPRAKAAYVSAYKNNAKPPPPPAPGTPSPGTP